MIMMMMMNDIRVNNDDDVGGDSAGDIDNDEGEVGKNQ